MPPPIYRLPEDVLLELFFLCSEVDWDGDRPAFFTDLDWDWIVVTHVCKYWRDLALSSPLLWCKPALARHSRGRLEAFLERSQEAPLTIFTFIRCRTYISNSGNCEKCTENALFSLSHLQHVRRLHIHCADHRIIDALLDNTASRLESLEVTSTQMSGHQIRLPDSFLASCTPSLKTLGLHGFHLPYSSKILRCLERLEVDNYSYSVHTIWNAYFSTAAYYPTTSELFDVLVLCPNLTKLNLFTVRKSTDTNMRYSSHQVKLPNLESLEIQEIPVNVCKDILHYIDIPVFTDIDLGVRYSDVSELPSILPILTFVNDFKRCESLNLDLMGSRTCGRARTILEDDMYGGHSSLSLVQVEEGDDVFEDNINYGEIAGMMTNLIRGSSWKDVAELNIRVSSHYALDESQWRMLLDSFQSVESLKIVVDDLPIDTDADRDLLEKVALLEDNLIDALMLQSEHTNEDISQITVVLPHLKRLRFHLHSINRNSDRLIRCIEARKENGSAIQNLGIITFEHGQSYQQTAAWHEEARRIVTHFFCHGS